jgi:5-(carboxyamino)imidazole ribonucleotide synthase
MVNLVGAEGFTGNVVYENMENIRLDRGYTIYGKKMTRPLENGMSPS